MHSLLVKFNIIVSRTDTDNKRRSSSKDKLLHLPSPKNNINLYPYCIVEHYR